MRKLIILLVFIFISGCREHSTIDSVVEKYHATADQVNIGDSKLKALKVLLPTQQELHPNYKKPTKKTMLEGRLVEVYFIRSGQFDVTASDCENYTPYVFVDGILQLIGCVGSANQNIQINNQFN